MSDAAHSVPGSKRDAPPAAPGTTLPPRRRLVLCAEVVALTVLGLVLAGVLRGHSIKPHNDFVEFAEVGMCLVRGQMPPTFQRGPVYPLLIGVGGEALHRLGVHDPPPERLAAEFLHLALLPLNAVLVYLLARRWCVGHAAGPEAARWVAAAFLVVPWGLYCTAYLLVEPLLITFVLGTLLLAGTRHRWLSYVAAAVATMTRFDAAALIPGLMLADRLRRPPVRHWWQPGLFAALPLVIWLVLTALTWSRCGEEHYLRHLRERPGFRPVWAVRAVLDATFSPERLYVPSWVSLAPELPHAGLRWILAIAGVGGTVWLLVRRDAAAVAAAVGALGYLLVHAVFPYRFLRFGYPLVPLLLVAAGGGLTAGWQWLGVRRMLHPLRLLGIAVVVIFGLSVALGELGSLVAGPVSSRGWIPTLLVWAAIPLVVLWAAPWLRRPAHLARLVPLLALFTLIRVQLRETTTILGDEHDMATLVTAARWVAGNVPAQARVVCDHRALFFLYARDRDPTHFLSFDRLRAETWPDILAECRQHGIGFLVWHSRIEREHPGPRDAARFRFQRFAALEGEADVPGLERLWQVRGDPDVWIWRIVPSALGSSAAAPEATPPSSDDAAD